MNSSEYSIISLSDLLEQMGEGIVSKMLSTFKTIAESDTESFLREKAIEMEKRDVSRTYIGITSDGITVLGYITISIKCLRVPSENLLSGKTLKHMNIDGETGIAQSYLIGQLSRSKASDRGFGEALMDAAFEHLGEAKRKVGCRLVRLDCHEELVPYYQKHGFKLVSANEDGSLTQMIRAI